MEIKNKLVYVVYAEGVVTVYNTLKQAQEHLLLLNVKDVHKHTMDFNDDGKIIEPCIIEREVLELAGLQVIASYVISPPYGKQH